jgi:hypothetical protein
MPSLFGLLESHTSRIFIWTNSTGSISPCLAPTVPSVEPTAVGLIRGDWAMWIIWYVAMMASLRAMGLAPSPVLVRTDEDRTPYGDI